MGLFNVFRKRDVPAELPPLGFSSKMEQFSNEIHSEQNSGLGYNPLFERQSDFSDEKIVRPLVKPNVVQKNNSPSKYKQLPVDSMDMQDSITVSKTKRAVILDQGTDDEKGFFKDLINDLTGEIDSSKLSVDYKNKILSGDIVHQMKGYWEGQRPQVFLKNAGKDLKQKLLVKSQELTSLEKEWQESYFDLIAKEEKIRNQEKELKQMLSELMNIYEKSLSRASENASSEDQKQSSTD